MSFIVIIDGKRIERKLEGKRTLAEILTDTEYQRVDEGTLIAVTENGGIMSYTSPLTEGQTIILRAPLPEDREVFMGKHMDKTRTINLLVFFAENRRWQIRALFADSESTSDAPPGHGDAQEYEEESNAIGQAYLWASLILSQGYKRVVVFKEGSEIACLDSEEESNTAYKTHKETPSDYETCGYCGFDHEYEPSHSKAWHEANPCSYCNYNPNTKEHEETCSTLNPSGKKD